MANSDPPRLVHPPVLGTKPSITGRHKRTEPAAEGGKSARSLSDALIDEIDAVAPPLSS
jgi:hypothetical protein